MYKPDEWKRTRTSEGKSKESNRKSLGGESGSGRMLWKVEPGQAEIVAYIAGIYAPLCGVFVSHLELSNLQECCFCTCTDVLCSDMLGCYIALVSVSH